MTSCSKHSLYQFNATTQIKRLSHRRFDTFIKCHFQNIIFMTLQFCFPIYAQDTIKSNEYQLNSRISKLLLEKLCRTLAMVSFLSFFWYFYIWTFVIMKPSSNLDNSQIINLGQTNGTKLETSRYNKLRVAFQVAYQKSN